MGRVTVAVFIDALGAEIAGFHGFLADRVGQRRALETVLGYSSSAIPSLLSGRYPREHGHFSMYRRDGGAGVFRALRPLMWLAHHTKGRGRLRRWIKSRLDKQIDGYFELYDIPLNLLAHFDLCQKQDIFKPGGMAPAESFIDRLHASGLPYRVWTWKVDEVVAFEELLREVRRGESRFLLLYTAALDALMHATGVESDQTRAKLREYEAWIRRIVTAASDRELRLYVFSDHGMTDVRQSHDVHSLLSRTGLRVPRDYLVFTDSTMARFWFSGEVARRRIREALPSTGWARWLTEAETAAYGIDFPDGRYGQAIYLLEPGHVIVPSFMGATACAAMHGYGPEDRTCKAWFYASHASDPAPASILDLRDLLAREIGWLRGRAEEGSP